MDGAAGAYVNLVRRALRREQADRHAALCTSQKGQRKLLEMLCHQFASGIRDEARRPAGYTPPWELPCYAFFQPLGFGVAFASVRVACERLALEDGWLIVVSDGSAGIYRPEGRWDEEVWLGTGED